MGRLHTFQENNTPHYFKNIQSGHSGEDEISRPCQETNGYSSVVQPVAHSLHPISYPALCIFVYVWQAEHVTLEQPISQLSSSDSSHLEPINMKGTHPWRGGYNLHNPQPHKILKLKKKFLYMVLSNVLRDLPFSETQPMKLTDDWYICILKY